MSIKIIFLALCPILSLAGWLTMFAIKHKNLKAGDVAGVIYHLSLVPLVSELSAPTAIRFAGYLWLYMDAFVDIVSINGIGQATAWSFRMGVHLFAGIWIGGVSWQLGGINLVIGLPLGLGLIFHALFFSDLPSTKQLLGIFVIPLMSAWLIGLEYFLVSTYFHP